MSQAQVFQALNEQLACIADAGVPMQEGLRLVAHEVRSRTMRRAIDQVVQDLENGKDLADAFKGQAGIFPELYHQVIHAGVASGKMSLVLIAFGRYLAAQERVKRQLWQAVAYPLVCIVVLMLVATFLALGPIPILASLADPQMGVGLFSRTSPATPWLVTVRISLLLSAARIVPWVCAAVVALFVLAPVVWWALGRKQKQTVFTDVVLARMPLLGRAMVCGVVARWCEALAVCTEAQMELGEAIVVAGRLAGWPRVQADSADMAAALRNGATLRLGEGAPWRIIPPAVRMSLQLAAERQDLPHTARALAELYQRQTETRAAAIITIVPPLLLFLIAAMVLTVIGALIAPMITVLSALKAM